MQLLNDTVILKTQKLYISSLSANQISCESVSITLPFPFAAKFFLFQNKKIQLSGTELFSNIAS